MDENPEAHMDTDVSSTTEDILEVQEVSGSHHNVETVIVVEKIKEEDMSPNKDKTNDRLQQAKPATSDKTDIEKAKSSPKPIQLKRIIIKPLNKDIQIKPLQKSPAKSDTITLTQKSPPKLNTVVLQPVEAVVDSSSKIDAAINASKVTEIAQKSPSKPMEVPTSVQLSPAKAKPPQVSTAIESKTLEGKDSPFKPTPIKEQSPCSIKDKEPSTKPTKELAQEVVKEQPVTQPVQVTPIKLPSKTPAQDPVVDKPKLDVAFNKEESKTCSISLTEDVEASNDSQTNSETSEKEHNKSISRELRSLINSAKESKIINECTQLTSKTRKSRTPLDTSLNTSIDTDKVHVLRRVSTNSQKSESSEKSDKSALKRSMRSQNPEFVTKVKSFLNSVTGKHSDEDDEKLETEMKAVKAKEVDNEASSSQPKKKKIEEVASTETVNSNKLRADPYCWRCHWVVETTPNEKVHAPMQCTVCPRSFHFKCLTGPERNKINTEKNWVCPECLTILQAESSETRSLAMKKISLGMLCELLQHALKRMMELNGVEPFMQPVDRTEFPDYDKYVVHPMDLSMAKGNIASQLYGSTEAFTADVQWILHNSIIFNTLQSKLTAGARALVRLCRAEMGEIEACPECYSAAHARRPTWFTDVCTTPHILLWAKLKGFPYWPAKGMSVSCAGLVDVRFFGAHDRAWVPARDCFLYSEKDPNNFRTKRQDILDSMQEAERHIRNISRKYGQFAYPPFRTPFDPSKLCEQIKLMIPSFEGEVRSPMKDKPAGSSPGASKEKRSNSKSSKTSNNNGETSEGEDVSTVWVDPKIAEDAAKANEKKEKVMEVDVPHIKESEVSRKRRRSGLEEATITVLDTLCEKKKRVEDNEKKAEEIKTPETKEVRDKQKVEEKSKTDSAAKKVSEKAKEDIIKKVQEKSKENVVKESVVTKKTEDKIKDIAKGESPKPKVNEPSSSTEKGPSTPKVAPIRVISITKVIKSTTGSVSPKVAGKEEKQKIKYKIDRPAEKEAESSQTPKTRPERRRNSRNKSLNNSNAGKADQGPEKKSEKVFNHASKDKYKDNANKSASGTPSSSDSTMSTKDRIRFDDDTSLAVLARGTVKTTNMPTISSVRSLSTAKSTETSKTVEVTIEANSNSSIFTPTNTDNVKNMKEAVNKLQKLRGEEPTTVGRVGVRAFARMTSPPEKEKDRPNDMQVEIKAEPMELDDADRQMAKMDLMNAFHLRPVNPQSSPNLREVRINKVVPPPRKVAPKPPEVRPRAKKTFPQPKKPEDGQLISKNSMVYIPIQPPMTQAPVRAQRPIVNGPVVTPPVPRLTVPVNVSAANNAVNTGAPPLIPMSISTLSSPTTSIANSGPSVPNMGHVPTIGQVPTTVHTVPLITSVNGQWMFSMQPVMSVGGVEGSPSPSTGLMNGLSERGTAIVPINSPAPLPGPTSAPALAPLARNTGDTTAPGELPRLQQRPSLVHPLDPAAPLGTVPPPSGVGPLTAKLNQHAVKMTDFFRTLLEETMEKLDDPTAQLTSLKLQLEQFKWRHQQELDEVKHTHELTLGEMRSSFEKEKARLVNETRRAAQTELEAAVKLAKTKQWCANCCQEAQFYCCWNTSYCDYPCQRAHWTQHYAVCAQQRHQDGNDSASSPDSRLQPHPDNLPKTTAAPNLTVGGKLAPSRVYTQEQTTPKTSIIVSMVEDNTGNQTVKCVGTYKGGPQSSPMTPVLLNKQLMNSEEAAKKVVTSSSGGYLIVGAAPTNTPSVTPARRTHTVQYLS